MTAAQPALFRQELLAAASAVHRFALHLTRDPVEAEDLVQETYLKAWTRRHQFQQGTSCRAWLFTICRNAFLKGVARAVREVAVEDAELEALAAAALHAGMQGTDPLGTVFESAGLRPLPATLRSTLLFGQCSPPFEVATAGSPTLQLGTIERYDHGADRESCAPATGGSHATNDGHACAPPAPREQARLPQA